jgi:molybdopterin molybdotransferase
LTSIEEVTALIGASIGAQPPIELPLARTPGLVLAAPVLATGPLPRFDNAAMDGFAVRTADVASADPSAPVRLRLVASSLAGRSPPAALPRGAACPVATGAPIPDETDAVIMLEHVVEQGSEVLITRPVGHGENIRRQGEDVRAGTELLRAGQVVTPGQIAAAAALGRTTLQVHRPPRVTIVLTGPEVVPPGRPLGPYQLYDAVGSALEAMLAELGCVPATAGPIDDDPDALADALLTAAGNSDALLTVGGASVGRRDHVKDVARRYGDVHVWRVALRPAKPFVFGTVTGTPLFGLPGNPASALAAYEVFVRPALLAMQGRAEDRPTLRAELTVPFSQRPGRLHLVRAYSWVRADRRFVRPVGAQGAGMLHALAAANAWMLVPGDVEHLPVGAVVEIRSLWRAVPPE